MRMARFFVLGLLVLGSGAGFARAEDKPGRGEVALRALQKEAKRLRQSWALGLRKSRKARATLEAVRREARRAERVKAPTAKTRRWSERWSAVDRIPTRMAIQRDYEAWAEALTPLLALHAQAPLSMPLRSAMHDATRERVGAWIEIGEPNQVWLMLRRDRSGVKQALAMRGSDATRRALLADILARIAATPGHSDVDALASVTNWAGLVLGNRTGAAQLNLLSKDLILLLTERDVDGISLSKAGHYTPGRFRDRGFAEPLRDGSDQVRHFAWAFRMFAASADADATAWFLTLKEKRDAAARKVPLNQADLALNKAARQLVDTLRGRRRSFPHAPPWGGRIVSALGE